MILSVCRKPRKNLFDKMFINKICPPVFYAFDYIPAMGAYRGSIIIWKSHCFTTTIVFQNDFYLSMEFCSSFNNNIWTLSNIYAPCTYAGKRDFLNWFKNVQMSDTTNWILVGDFNLYRRPSDRNKPGGIILRCTFSMKP